MFSKDLFGHRIAELRKRCGETQVALSEILGIGKNQVSAIECGNTTTSAERIALICLHYGVSADYLLGLTDDPIPPEARAEAKAGKIILASQSPRRRELLAQIGITDFVVRPAKGEERAPAGLEPGALVELLSCQKAEEVAGASGPADLIIAADTVVAVEGRILGKPHSPAEAAEMLAELSGRTHQVCTGVTVRRGEVVRTEHETSSVRFRSLNPQEIAAYVATGEPMDKAGAYGVQGRGAVLVEGIQGDYSNVVGLPLCRLGQMLKKFGVETL